MYVYIGVHKHNSTAGCGTSLTLHPMRMSSAKEQKGRHRCRKKGVGVSRNPEDLCQVRMEMTRVEYIRYVVTYISSRSIGQAGCRNELR